MTDKYYIARNYLSHWGAHERIVNHCGYDPENILYKILKRNIITVLKIDELSDIDLHKVKIAQQIINNLKLYKPECVYVLSRLYCDRWSIRNIAKKPLEGRTWSKSTVDRIIQNGLATVEAKINNIS